MKLGMNIPFKTQAKTEVKVDKNNWVNDIDRDIIPYIKEPEWKYSYPTKTAISISKEEKEIVEHQARVIFNAMNKTVKCVRIYQNLKISTLLLLNLIALHIWLVWIL